MNNINNNYCYFCGKHVSLEDNVLPLVENERICHSKCLKIQEEHSLAMKEYYEQEKQDEIKRQEKNTFILNEIKGLVSDSYYKDISDYLVECENTDEYELCLSDVVFGEFQKELDYSFSYVNISQTVGICGDDFSGTIFIPIVENKYFKFNYWM